jgi:hypothetical protein
LIDLGVEVDEKYERYDAQNKEPCPVVVVYSVVWKRDKHYLCRYIQLIVLEDKLPCTTDRGHCSGGSRPVQEDAGHPGQQSGRQERIK